MKGSGKSEMERFDKEDAEAIFARLLVGEAPSLINIANDGARVSKELMSDRTARPFHWAPACETDDLNPLVVPSLRFPFTAYELAAFMVDGVGAHLRSHYGPWQTGPDEQLLDEINPMASRAKRALRDAYAAYRQAELAVGERPVNLERKSQELVDKLREKNQEANDRAKLYEPGISEDERNERRDSAFVSTADLRAAQALASAQADAAYRQWRRTIVQHLLSREYALASWDWTLKASMWWRLKDVTPIEAAMLLCGLNPRDEGVSGESLATAGEPLAEDYKVMLRWFEDVAKDDRMRTMKQWLDCATRQGLSHHSWIDEWTTALFPSDQYQDYETEVTEVTRPGTMPVQRGVAHDAQVLAALESASFDPKRLPKTPPGKKSKAKAAAKSVLPRMSPEVFKKTWQRLRKAGRISEDDPVP